MSGKVAKRLKEIPKKYGIPSDKIDIEHIVDSSLSFVENKKRIEAECKKYCVASDMEELSVEEAKRIEEALLDKQIEEAERQVEEKEAEALEQIKGGKLNKFYQQIYWLVDSLLDSDKTKALVLQSPAGLGKTYNVIRLLNKRRLTVHHDYRIVSGHITPLDFYQILYDFQNGIIVIDDIETVFSQPQTLSLLLQALNTETSNTVEWKTTSSKLDRPSKCQRKGKILILCNKFPTHNDSIMSRLNFFPFDFTYKERLKMMDVIAKENKIPTAVMQFIEKETNEHMTMVDFRLLFKIFDFYKTNKKHWKEMAKAVMKSDEELSIIREIAQSGMSTKEQVSHYISRAGKGRTTYFKRKRELGL
jgi:L-fucose mutarotase/ribose pyranase (RbsD/FucU family)